MIRMFQIGRRGWTDLPVPGSVRRWAGCPCCADHYVAKFEAYAYGLVNQLPGPIHFVEYFERATDTRPPWPMLCAHCWRRLPKSGRAKYSRIS